MDGDVSQKYLSVAHDYGRMIYTDKKHNQTNKTMTIFKDNAKWESRRLNDIDSCKRDDPEFQNMHYFSKFQPFHEFTGNLINIYPDLQPKIRTGSDRGTFKQHVVKTCH